MTLGAASLVSLFLIFVRISACLLASPLFGNTTPVQVRVLLCAAIAFALNPVLSPYIQADIKNLGDFLPLIVNEVAIGILIGMCLQMVVYAAQMAGSLLDIQIGMASMQLFNPLAGSHTTLFGSLKMWLSLVLILLLDGHHMMLGAFVQSYQLTASPVVSMAEFGLVQLLGKMCLLAIQIAAPAGAVALLVDIAAGIVNKSVPQMQVYMVAMPGKILMGVMAVTISLPILVSGVTAGLEHSFDALSNMTRTGGPAHGVK